MKPPSIIDLSRRAFLLRSETQATSAPGVLVTEHCLTAHGVYCESCRDACEFEALRFVPQLGAVPKPTIDPELCTQCGECVQACPKDGIRLRPNALTHG